MLTRYDGYLYFSIDFALKKIPDLGLYQKLVEPWMKLQFKVHIKSFLKIEQKRDTTKSAYSKALGRKFWGEFNEMILMKP